VEIGKSFLESLVMDANFWKGKRTLISGHTGFKGGWLSLWLQNKGTHVIGYSLDPPTQPNLFEIGKVSEGMTSIIGDVRDLQHLKAVFAKHNPEIVIHMAAQPLVRLSYKNPVETYSTNVMGTVNVLESIKHSESVEVALIITSDKCYENKEFVRKYREDDPMGGHDPYSSSKGCAELITSAYCRSYFSNTSYLDRRVSVASARAGNVIGGGDWGTDRLIPDFIKGSMKRQPVIIRYPHAIRPWQHVLEPLDGYLCLVERLWEHGSDFVGGWNFGPDDEDCKSVSWIVKNLDRLWDDSISWELGSAKEPYESTYLKLDCSKAERLLGWLPKLNLSTALEWVVEWYKAYFENENMREVTEAQILRYEKM
jgi:CDP-glucose 4,6-dehydratase